MTWKEFVKQINSGRYVGGVAISFKGKTDLGGPISKIEINDVGLSVFVRPCMGRKVAGWYIDAPQPRILSEIIYSQVDREPSIDREGAISYFANGARVKICPKEHQYAEEILALKETT